VIFHVVLLALLAMTGFHTPLPLPEEEGILVNFGYDNTGSGLTEPSQSPSNTQEEQAVSQEALPVENPVTEEVVSSQANLTQEFEEAPEVVKQAEKPDPEELRKQQEAKRQEELRQQQIEAERIKKEKEEAEAKRIQEEKDREAREAAELKKREDEIRNRTLNALSNSEAAGAGTGKNQGISGGKGNQGVETGAVNATNYGEGSGTGTRGISYNLAGRQPLKIPQPVYDIQSEGIVVVEVTVDRNGNVTQADPGVKGSTTLEEYFLKVAKDAALKAKFNIKPDAPLFQKGTITYHFILN
jgi:colicin import membrane protein